MDLWKFRLLRINETSRNLVRHHPEMPMHLKACGRVPVSYQSFRETLSSLHGWTDFRPPQSVINWIFLKSKSFGTLGHFFVGPTGPARKRVGLRSALKIIDQEKTERFEQKQPKVLAFHKGKRWKGRPHSKGRNRRLAFFYSFLMFSPFWWICVYQTASLFSLPMTLKAKHLQSQCRLHCQEQTPKKVTEKNTGYPNVEIISSIQAPWRNWVGRQMCRHVTGAKCAERERESIRTSNVLISLQARLDTVDLVWQQDSSCWHVNV